MRALFAHIVLCFCLSGCAGMGQSASVQPTDVTFAQRGESQFEHTQQLDGLVVDGSIRARGVLGLFSVPGTLSFRQGMLVWTARGAEDTGRYSVREVDGGYEFTAEHLIERGEHVRWSGSSNGRTVTNVVAVWTREEGDWVHDLLLPEQVTLEFTPDS